MEEYYEIQRIDKGIQYIQEKKGYREKEKQYTALVPQIVRYICTICNRSWDMEQFIISVYHEIITCLQ